MKRALGVGLAAAVLASPLSGQACPDGRPPVGDLGFQWLHCSNGGPCWMSDEGTERWYDLANVPRVRTVYPEGPAAQLLRDGDMIVAVDGLLTTTIAGGRHLANLVPGRPVTLLVQRGSAERTAVIVPVPRCGIMGLAVNSVPDSAGFANRMSSPPSPQRRLFAAPATVAAATIRRSTPLLDLEIEGEIPVVRVDSITGTVTLEFRHSRIIIHPNKPERSP